MPLSFMNEHFSSNLLGQNWNMYINGFQCVNIAVTSQNDVLPEVWVMVGQCCTETLVFTPQ
jgi:hypothetical protein